MQNEYNRYHVILDQAYQSYSKGRQLSGDGLLRYNNTQILLQDCSPISFQKLRKLLAWMQAILKTGARFAETLRDKLSDCSIDSTKKEYGLTLGWDEVLEECNKGLTKKATALSANSDVVYQASVVLSSNPSVMYSASATQTPVVVAEPMPPRVSASPTDTKKGDTDSFRVDCSADFDSSGEYGTIFYK